MPYRVRENLFIGNISDAAEILQNGSTEITHILSVRSSASISVFAEWKGLTIPTKEIKKVYAGGSGGASASEDDSGDRKKGCLVSDKLLYLLEHAGKDLKLVRMGVPLRDTANEDLLDYLDVCFDFIDRSRKEGSVLVHCFAGVSRSAAIITAYLMRTENLSQEDALKSLRQSCDFVCPNDGFLDQLKMYEEMGFKVDCASPIYMSFRLKVLGESYHRGDRIDSSKFGADPGVAGEVASGVEAASNEGKTVTPAFRCKKCRRVVALQDNVEDHIPGEGEQSFGWRKRKSSNSYNKYEDSDSECSSIFVEPLKWMTAVAGGIFLFSVISLTLGSLITQSKKVQWRESCPVCIAKLVWVTSIGQAPNAVVEAGSPLPSSSTKTELTSAPSNLSKKSSRRGPLPTFLRNIYNFRSARIPFNMV